MSPTAATLMLALQGGAMAAPASPAIGCSLVTPGADPIDFALVSGSGTDAVLAPRTGSVWPQAAMAASRPGREQGGASRLVVGGQGGLVLDISGLDAERRSAVGLLSRWNGRRPTYPVAVGVCRLLAEAPSPVPTPSAPPPSIDVAAFDPARWPDHCGLLLGDGRRVRFDYTISGPRGPVRIESPSLWGGQPVTVPWGGGSGNSRFGGRTGPAGSERMGGEADIRVKIINFSRIGDPAVSAQTGIGICAYRNIVRRPVLQ